MDAGPAHDVMTPSPSASPVPLSRYARGEVRATRRRLRSIRAELAEFAPEGDLELGRVARDLELLETEAAARP